MDTEHPRKHLDGMSLDTLKRIIKHQVLNKEQGCSAEGTYKPKT